jgi:hypothetical protein
MIQHPVEQTADKEEVLLQKMDNNPSHKSSLTLIIHVQQMRRLYEEFLTVTVIIHFTSNLFGSNLKITLHLQNSVIESFKIISSFTASVTYKGIFTKEGITTQ